MAAPDRIADIWGERTRGFPPGAASDPLAAVRVEKVAAGDGAPAPAPTTTASEPSAAAEPRR